MRFEFQKFCGSGNDFIIIDNRNFAKLIKNRAEFAKNYCRQHFSIGADGVLFLENSSIADFKMALFQPDGSQAEMCGNGGRCIARYAFLNGIANKEMKFETLAGLIEARIYGDSVAVKLTAPQDLRVDKSLRLEDSNETYIYSFINTGVPHIAIFTDDLNKIDIKRLGHKIRFHSDFAPAGTNVNFVVKNSDNSISIRTYERGVEDETFACGTGSSAAALIASLKYNIQSPVSVRTKSGLILKIHFDCERLRVGDFDNVNLFLEGDANKIYDGVVDIPEEYF